MQIKRTSSDIVFVVGRDPRSEVSGGHSSYVRSYAMAALGAGFTPHLFCAGPADELAKTDYGVIHVIGTPLRPFRQTAAGRHAPRLAEAIATFGRSGDGPLLIHSFGVWGIAAARAASTLRTSGQETVLLQSSYTTYRDEALSHVRGARLRPEGRPMRFLLHYLHAAIVVERWERRAYRAADAVIVNYASVERLIERRHGTMPFIRMRYASTSAFQTSPGDRETPSLPPGNAPLIVAISRHEPRKGIDVLLQALRILSDQCIPFRACLIGGGPLLDAHRALALQLGLEATVLVTGVVDDVRPYLAEATIYSLPSREEQSGSLALLEAMQAGLPIVASGVDGIMEDVNDGYDVLLVEPGDQQPLAAALARLLIDPVLCQRLGHEASETYRREFSAPSFTNTLAAIYGRFGFTARDEP